MGASFDIAAEVSDGAFSQPHNEYIRLRCDTGIVGETPALGFFVLIFLRTLWGSIVDPRGRRLHMAGLQMAAAFLLLGTTDNPLVYAGMFMAPLMLCVALSDTRMAAVRAFPSRVTSRPRQTALA